MWPPLAPPAPASSPCLPAPCPAPRPAQTLDLTNNSLAGTIPSSVGGLTALTTLDLTGNAAIALSVGVQLDVGLLLQQLGIAAAAGTGLVLCIVAPTVRRRRARLDTISTMARRRAWIFRKRPPHSIACWSHDSVPDPDIACWGPR